MSYIDGFVIPVATADKAAFTDHAKRLDQFFLDYGATRVVEGWGVDVPDGVHTDFKGAVEATAEESVVFSWVEWPDKATRQSAMKAMESNEAMMAEPMPFDGKRMIFGGFEPIVERGASASNSYIQGFIIPVPAENREAYRKAAEDCWAVLDDYGALRVVETWGDDVPAGKVTDFYRAVKGEDGETIVFSFIEWPSREVCDAAKDKIETDERMQPGPDFVMPFDGKRMTYGGFEPIVVLEA